MSSKNDVCVICGEPDCGAARYPVCGVCYGSDKNTHAFICFGILDVARGAIYQCYSLGKEYNKSNWQTHPEVIKRRQEVENKNDQLSRKICPTTGRFMGEIKFWQGARKPTAKYFQQVGRVLRGPPVLSGSINDLVRKGHLVQAFDEWIKDHGEKLPSLMQPRAKHETTHTFSAELPDGDVVTMPSPGDYWTKGETETFKRGDCRMVGACVAFDSPKSIGGYKARYRVHGFVNEELMDFVPENACWLSEFRNYSGICILSITTWTRAVKPMRQKIEHYETCYSDLVADKCSSLKTPECAWPDNGRPKRLLG